MKKMIESIIKGLDNVYLPEGEEEKVEDRIKKCQDKLLTWLETKDERLIRKFYPAKEGWEDDDLGIAYAWVEFSIQVLWNNENDVFKSNMYSFNSRKEAAYNMLVIDLIADLAEAMENNDMRNL